MLSRFQADGPAIGSRWVADCALADSLPISSSILLRVSVAVPMISSPSLAVVRFYEFGLRRLGISKKRALASLRLVSWHDDARAAAAFDAAAAKPAPPIRLIGGAGL
ncbi:hypothetical protein Mkiyose1665_54000 [Mycobacterium kiyosense]|uniref:Uncharacterized protein n=1 Tax=Mycobacterium kiyosense TaxID=2871094 RepID=A0A9P3Q0A1_9MYCO|nr:hypothetical protein IWGMT90018_28080 [Mycobacterium kiyosense]BDE14368.1 hypothetical protein MKCMC460_32280 [Mycobacterium sp. 20KCMC460]GLB83288.1 hypothetical protein SRL2020028_25440 [Mycobacterium kiyosense]GLB91208.1 hypothetical protein SRL2020130_40250 [Mycobacterium kiyosense]GLB98525.1 hypothetical protein SRL2020226_53010 [Mycobacterium kiyosense]